MRNRARITNVKPLSDNENYFFKRVTGGLVTVQANVFADGDDEVHAVIAYQFESDKEWKETPMEQIEPDFWAGQFRVAKSGFCTFKIVAWVGSRRDLATEWTSISKIKVSREKELFSTWYEMFPRSASPDVSRSGNFQDCGNLLPRIASMGFDILLLPPIFPIGKINRKGRDNSLITEDTDPGSPWSVGSSNGGHKELHPDMGGFNDFKNLVQKASDLGIDIAIDVGLRCSLDHPFIKQHPEWFHHDEKGIAIPKEDPPFSYRDILNFNFECAEWQKLWKELMGIIEFWIDKGIRIFYTNSTHKKPFTFWNWLITEIQQKYPEVIFVTGAVTRPIIMQELAKAGFSQSLTHFLWKTTKPEIESFINELVNTESREFLRPNFFTNTPDVLPKYLMGANEASFMIRYALAATLSSNCGIYGPVFELMENHENPSGREEYIHSEKYEIRHYHWNLETRLMHFIKSINQIRREQPALQNTFNLSFTKTDNDQLISFIKLTSDNSNIIWCIINLDPINKQSGYVEVPQELLGIRGRWLSLKVTELLSGETYHWFNDWNYVELKPDNSPIHLLKVDL